MSDAPQEQVTSPEQNNHPKILSSERNRALSNA